MDQVAGEIDIDIERLYRELLLPRLIEEKMLRLIRKGRLSKWFSGYGQEAVAVGCTLALEPTDYILPMHRNLGVWTARGVPLLPLFCQLFGKEGGFTKGRDRSFHFGLPEKRIIGMISHLAAMLPVACGLGLASKLKGEGFVALSFVGEGATREGDFHEALSLASVWKLPVLFVVENNGYGLSTPASEALPVENVADAANGYGMKGGVVDGNDVFEVMRSIKEAAAHARSGAGPVLIEMKTFRMRGHEEASGTRYVPPELFEVWRKKDPVERLQNHVLREGFLTYEDAQVIRNEIETRIDEAAERALTQPEVTGTVETERSAVFAPSPILRYHETSGFTEKRFVDAIRDGLRQAMESDDRVLLMGQDIAEYGGVFKVTEGFIEQFGRDRVRNTPIMESAVVGAAMGLALEFFKPVVEMQYADFVSCAFNQVVNNLAPTHYRWGAPLNVTIRLPYGGHIGAGPFHSQSMEAWFCHVPGLKVVVPSSPAEAKGLLLAAIAEPNPVLFFEHKKLYRSIKGPVPDDPVSIEFGVAEIKRPGSDLTIVTWGLGVHWALEEAEYFQTRGVSIEVVDLRTLIPWDKETVLRSVEKTGRLIVLHESPRTGGFGGEIAATITEEAFASLDAPPMRVAGEDIPVPFARNLEEKIFSASVRLRTAVENSTQF